MNSSEETKRCLITSVGVVIAIFLLFNAISGCYCKDKDVDIAAIEHGYVQKQTVGVAGAIWVKEQKP